MSGKRLKIIRLYIECVQKKIASIIVALLNHSTVHDIVGGGVSERGMMLV